MIFKPYQLIITILFIASIPFSLSLTALKYGNEIKDIYSLTGTCFTTEANTWQANQKFSTYVSNICSGYGIVGGANVLKAYGDYYYKTYSPLPTHTWIYYTMTIYAIDTWSYGSVGGGDDHFGLAFDGAPVDGFRLNFFNFYENVCGNSGWNDLRNVRVFGRFQHNLGSLQLRIRHLLDEDSNNESVGFREVNLIFANPSSSPGQTICGTAPFKGFTGECTCPEGEYYSGSACLGCHANCESCWGASASECYQCRPGTSFINGECTTCSAGCALCHGTTDTDCDACLTGYFFYNSQSCIYPCNPPLVKGTTTGGCSQTCSHPCTTLTDYIYWDGTCSSTCNFPYKPNTLNKHVKSCDFPCPDGSFLYWDGSCSTGCLAPLTTRITQGKKFCDFPCTDTEFAYWDGTCADNCLPPYQRRFFSGKQFCDFPCTATEYLYWNGSCISTCDFPLSPRTSKGDHYCDYPCKSAEFLYWDGSCEADCHSLLSTRVEGNPRPRNYCDFEGAITDYLYWNGTYHPTCNPLFTQRTFKGRNLCEYPCASTEYLYWNGSCLDDCPYKIHIEIPGVRFCNFKCTDPNDYLYWDNTCSSTCKAPLTSTTIGESSPKKLCTYPCDSTEVVFYNGTCADFCPIIFTSIPISGQIICQYPCNYQEFLVYTGHCQDNCPLPFSLRKTNGLGFCDYPCGSSEYLSWTGACNSSCPSPLRPFDGPLGEHFCDKPCDGPFEYYYVATGECKSSCNAYSSRNDQYLTCLPGTPQELEGFLDLLLTPEAKSDAPSLLVINRFTQYLRYLDAPLPNRLEMLSVSRARNVISLKMNIKPPAALSKWLTQRSLATAADEQGISPSFLINFFGDIVLLVVTVLFALLFQALEKLSENYGFPVAHAVFEKLRLLTMWNLCFALLALNADDIIIYAYLEIRSVSFSTPGGSASLFVAVVMVVLVLGLLMLAMYVVFRFRVFRKEAIKEKGDQKCLEFHQGWKRFQVLYRGYTETSSLRQSFYIMYILRTIIPQAIMAAFAGSPTVQTILQIVISVLTLAYILLLKPIKKRIDHIQLLSLEAAGLVINIAAFILTTIPVSLDGTLPSSHNRTFLGDLIILGGLFINVAILVFLVLKLLFAAQEIHRHLKANPNADKTVWLGLLVIPLQQAAFGFEEFMGENLLDIVESKKAENSYAKFSTVFPEPASPAIKLEENLQVPTVEITKKSELDEEPVVKTIGKGPSNIERIRRMKKEGTLADVRESSNASPGIEFNISPDSSEIGVSFGFGSKLDLSPTRNKKLLNAESKTYDFENKDDSPTKNSAAIRLQKLKALAKKSDATS